MRSSCGVQAPRNWRGAQMGNFRLRLGSLLFWYLSFFLRSTPCFVIQNLGLNSGLCPCFQNPIGICKYTASAGYGGTPCPQVLAFTWFRLCSGVQINWVSEKQTRISYLQDLQICRVCNYSHHRPISNNQRLNNCPKKTPGNVTNGSSTLSPPVISFASHSQSHRQAGVLNPM